MTAKDIEARDAELQRVRVDKVEPIFRDWLRTNEDDRRLYEEAKRRLAAQVWRHVQDYADAKTEVVREITERALRQAANAGTMMPDKT